MRRFNILILFLFLMLNVVAEEDVFTIYMLGGEIGESVDTWNEKRGPDGSCELELLSRATMKIVRGAGAVEMTTVTKLSADCLTLEPKRIESVVRDMSSGETLRGVNNGGLFSTEIIRGSKSEKSSVRLSSDATFFSLIFKKLREEDFLKGGRAKVISEESLRESEISYSGQKAGDGSVVATLIYQGIPMRYTLVNGKVMKSEVQNGLLVYRRKGAAVPDGTSVSSSVPDILEKSKNRNLGLFIAEPRKAGKVVYHVESDSFSTIPDTCFQKKNVTTGEITVDTTRQDCLDAPKKEDTMSNLYEDSSDPEIIKTAKKVAGNAVGRDEKIDRVAKFVSRYISNKNYDHSNLSASEVLRKKSGDCTEHSTLFAALMRALGVPVKMVYGLVMTPDGEFFFHNWNEALGDTGWVPVDSTFRLVPADAARITIIYGGADSGSREQVSLSVFRFLTGVKIRVKSFSEGGLRR